MRYYTYHLVKIRDSWQSAAGFSRFQNKIENVDNLTFCFDFVKLNISFYTLRMLQNECQMSILDIIIIPVWFHTRSLKVQDHNNTHVHIMYF